MLNLNVTVLSQVVDQAMTDAADHPRWLTAITKAVVELLSNPLICRQDGHLLVASKSTTAIHSANGTCTCEAFRFGKPCWHRSAARLVRLHDEAQAKLETARDQPVPAWECCCCHTSAYGPSGMQPAICYECSDSWLRGFSDRGARDRAAAAARAQREIDEVFGIGAD
jgi:SWIM zinc finger